MVKVGPSFSDFVSIVNPGNGRKNQKIFTGFSIGRLSPIFFLTLVFLVIFFKLFYLQIVRADYYKKLSENNRTMTKVVRSPRGIILDRNQNPLVRNVPSFRILKDDKVVWLSNEQGLEALSKGQDFLLEMDVQREYLYKDAFAHVLGFIGEISRDELDTSSYLEYKMGDFVGKMGLEKEYEAKMRGIDGKELFEVDAVGKVVRSLGRSEPVSGKDLISTLDLVLQKAAFEALADVSKAAVVASDPNTGGILAFVSRPSFDPNLFTHSNNYESSSFYKTVDQVLQDDKNQPLLNRAIGGLYPPGSTFKLVSAVAGLENGAITKDTKFEDTGVLTVGSFSFGNWYYLSYGKKEGVLDVVGALKRSNDIFFYKAAELTGVEKLSNMAKKFGLGQKLKLDLTGEEAGLVPDEAWKKKTIGESWYLGDVYHFGIGQGYLLTTPLQVNFLTSVFANGGTLYKPHLTGDTKEVLQKDFIKKENITLVRQGMRESCQVGGVAWPFFDFKVQNARLPVDGKDFIETEASGGAKMVKISLGCKTGTAETTKDANPHAWITVFAPFYKPEVVLTVLVENGGEGSNVAAPIAKKILEEYFSKK